jgi:apolipoprotein N-acyltransferase
LAFNAAYHPPVPQASWQAMDTKFGSGFSASDPLREFETAQVIQGIVRDSDRRVIVFPEMAVHRWNDAAKAFWEPTLIRLRQEDKTILLGAGLSLPGRQQSYLNAVVILGSHPASPFIQRIPVPIAMWKPFSTKDAVPLRLLGTGVTMVADQRAVFLICYEQLLIWPIITSVLEHPDILIGTANDYWAAGTPIPAVQTACLHAWARLFRFPCISAMNS